MREESLPPFGFGFSPRDLVRRVLKRLRARLRKRSGILPSLDGRAAAIIREHESTHAALFERAARLAGKAGRLEAAGTPSESASNRAERARKEVEVEFAALRTFFTTATGEQGREAFNRQVRSRHPGLKLPDTGR